jgi:hypothetical protein
MMMFLDTTRTADNVRDRFNKKVTFFSPEVLTATGSIVIVGVRRDLPVARVV